MKLVRPRLMDVIAPPINPWLHRIMSAKAADLPDGVRLVRFENPDDDTDGEDLPPTASKRRPAAKDRCPA